MKGPWIWQHIDQVKKRDQSGSLLNEVLRMTGVATCGGSVPNKLGTASACGEAPLPSLPRGLGFQLIIKVNFNNIRRLRKNLQLVGYI